MHLHLHHYYRPRQLSALRSRAPHFDSFSLFCQICQTFISWGKVWSLPASARQLSKHGWIYLLAIVQTFTTSPPAFRILFTSPAGGIDRTLTFPGCHQSPLMAVLITTSCQGLQSAVKGSEKVGGGRVGLGGSGRGNAGAVRL